VIGPSTANCIFFGWLGRGDGMMLSTVRGIVTLSASEIGAVSRFSSAIVADLAMRGFAEEYLQSVRQPGRPQEYIVGEV
jgi:hypothetical protein